MRNKAGIFCMMVGTALILGALSLFLLNEKDSRDAEAFAENVMPALQEEILDAIQTAPTDADASENTPVELLRPEDLIMTEKYINGYPYIGYLTIPDLNLELPVMSNWNSQRLMMSPCRFMGTVKGEDLVIMAHNYKSHFGQLSSLTEGAKVRFVDMDGVVWDYKIVMIEVLAAEDVEEMTAGEYDLSLFTCTTNRSHRVTVRCNKVKE
jgi:sortase A